MTALLDELLDLGEKRGRELIGTKRELLPYFLLVKPDGTRVLISTPWTNNIEKDIAVQTIRMALRSGDFIAYLFDHEGWMLNLGKGEKAPEGSIADHPNRIECFLATACDGSTEKQKIWEIRRDSQGNCTDLVYKDGSIQTSNGPRTLEGRLTNLFE